MIRKLFYNDDNNFLSFSILIDITITAAIQITEKHMRCIWTQFVSTGKISQSHTMRRTKNLFGKYCNHICKTYKAFSRSLCLA